VCKNNQIIKENVIESITVISLVIFRTSSTYSRFIFFSFAYPYNFIRYDYRSVWRTTGRRLLW